MFGWEGASDIFWSLSAGETNPLGNGVFDSRYLEILTRCGCSYRACVYSMKQNVNCESEVKND